jgi:cyanophycinase
MPSPVSAGPRGFIVPIGGAEDKEGDRAILRRFVRLTGGRAGRIAVVPTASRVSDTGARYRALFKDLGARDVRVVAVRDRRDVDRAGWEDALEDATGIFFTGGNQLRLSTILGGTALATRIRRLNAAGTHVAGTSAGAAFVSEHMIALGAEGPTPLVGMASMAPGLGLTNRIVVDQHFRHRDRLGRLLAALSTNPFAVGLGVDEDTAAFLSPENVVEVVGSGAVTVVDVSGVEHSTAASASPGAPVQIVGVRLHVLGHGARYDLESRTAVLPDDVQDE